MSRRIRDIKIEFYVTHDEKVKMLFSSREQKFRSLSAYLRKVSLCPVVHAVEIDEKTFRKMASDLSRLGNNVNQIARALHQGQVFEDEIKNIEEQQKSLMDSFSRLHRLITRKFQLGTR